MPAREPPETLLEAARARRLERATWQKASQRYGIDARDIFVAIGRRKLIGGQKDMIADVALDLIDADTK